MPNAEIANPQTTPAPLLSILQRQGYQDTSTSVFRQLRDDANLMRKPEYYVYVFNISPRSFTVRRPPSFPMINLEGCSAGQPYRCVARIPHPVVEVSVVDDRPLITGISGKRFATDILNPANLTEDIWREIQAAPDDPMSNDPLHPAISNDLTRRGLFWSLHEIPTEDELQRARAKMERYYRALLSQGDSLSRTPQGMKDILLEHHLAADYFAVNTPWHQAAPQRPDICENCGEQVKSSVAYHINSAGMKCIRDWTRAYEAGVVKHGDIPAHILKQWEDEKKAKASG